MYNIKGYTEMRHITYMHVAWQVVSYASEITTHLNVKFTVIIGSHLLRHSVSLCRDPSHVKLQAVRNS